ncbi:phage major capsid protein [[Clostridium] sporosphaeroides]
MMTITEMRNKRAKLWNTMEGFLDTHRNDMGVLSAEDDATYSKMERDLDSLTNEIKRMERRDAIEAELNKPVNQPITEAPERAASLKPDKVGRASDAYKEDFDRHLRGKVLVHNVLSEGVDADGGYLVPEDFERDIVTALEEENVIRSLAKVITTQHERKIPVATGHSTAQWTAENAAYTESNPTFGQKQIDAFKLTDLARVSVELLQDSAFDIEDYLMKEFARAFGIAEEEAFCVGTGTNQPTGIFTANGGTVGVTAAANNAITADELISLVYALKSPYRRNAKFLMNDATVSIIRKLKDKNDAYLWQPSLQAGEPDRLLGYELYTSPYVPTVAAGALTVAFGDFKNYWIGDRAGRTVQRLNELYATNGQIGYVATERVDGKVILPEGIQLLKMKATSGS